MGVESWDLNPGSLTLELTPGPLPSVDCLGLGEERALGWQVSEGQGDSAWENGAALSAPIPTWKHGEGVMWRRPVPSSGFQ